MKALATLVALLCALAAADAARAATVMHDAHGNVVLDAVPGETNTVFVQPGNGDTVILNDATAPLQAWDDACDAALRLDGGVRRRRLRRAVGSTTATTARPSNRAFPAGVFMHGEAGDDQLVGAPVVSGLDGGPGDDVLDGYAGAQVLRGGADDDRLSGGLDADQLHGDDGNDLLSGDGYKDPSADTIDGGAGEDRIESEWSQTEKPNVPISVTLDGVANDGRAGESDNVVSIEKLDLPPAGTLIGSDGPDSFDLQPATDRGPMAAQGRGGNDTIVGDDDVEQLDGGPGDDYLEGGFADDTIVGGPGRDRVFGDDTGATCWAYGSCTMPYGNDTIDVRDGELDQVDCGIGVDTVDRGRGRRRLPRLRDGHPRRRGCGPGRRRGRWRRTRRDDGGPRSPDPQARRPDQAAHRPRQGPAAARRRPGGRHAARRRDAQGQDGRPRDAHRLRRPADGDAEVHRERQAQAPPHPPRDAGRLRPSRRRDRRPARDAPALGVLGLAQQRAGRLLQDSPPGAGLLALGGEVAHHLPDPRRGDVDAVTAADLAQLVVVLGQLQGHGLEAMAGDVDARGEVEDVRLEHQLVVRLGLDQDDVDARVALPSSGRPSRAGAGRRAA